MLSDSKHMQTKKKNKRPLSATHSSWGDKQKQECVEIYYMLGGKIKETAAATGIPFETIKSWLKSEWWKELYDEIKQTDNIVLSHRLQKIMSRSLDLVEDRIENGDFFYDQKKGEIVRKDIGIRDAHTIFKDSFLVKEAIEKPNMVQVDQESVSEKLNALASQFEQFAKVNKNKKPEVIQVTDVVFIPEKKDEVQDGLQEERQEGEIKFRT